MFHWWCGSAIFVLSQVLNACFFWERSGEEGTKKRFVWRGSAPTSNTVPFIYYRKPNYIPMQNKIIAKKYYTCIHLRLEIFATSSFNMTGHYFSWLLYFALQYTDWYVRRYGYWSVSFVHPARALIQDSLQFHCFFLELEATYRS